MKVISVNVSLPIAVAHNGNSVQTGIFKRPVAGRIMAHKLNLDGDGQGDLRVHGGEHKAVYAYPAEHYAVWEHELSRRMEMGQFGENLTLEGLTEETTCIGDVFRVGEALLQVTQPRVPCFKLGLKMGDPQFPKAFLASGRSGFYLRVLEEGTIGDGDVVAFIDAAPERVSVRDINNLVHFKRGDRALARRALQVPALSPEWQKRVAALLEQP